MSARWGSAALLSVLVLSACGAMTAPVVTTITESTAPGYPVVAITDGDTLRVDIDGETVRVRILGIDTPEMSGDNVPDGGECYAQEATAKLAELVANVPVTLIPDPTQDPVDRYGRTLAYLSTPDGTDVGLTLVRGGYAPVYNYDKRRPIERLAQYREAENNAQVEDLGLWKVCE